MLTKLNCLLADMFVSLCTWVRSNELLLWTMSGNINAQHPTVTPHNTEILAGVNLGNFSAILGRVLLKCDGTRWRTGGEVKGKLANGVTSQYPSHYLGTWCIQHYCRWCAHLGCQQSTELTPPPQFKWTRPFRWKTKSGFSTCAITFQTQSNFSIFLTTDYKNVP